MSETLATSPADLVDDADYDQQRADLETEILHLTALRNAQEPGSATHGIYQERITSRTRTLLALEVSVDDLRASDARLARAQWKLDHAQAVADRDMDTTWRVVKFAGCAGTLGLGLTAVWGGAPWWLPAGSTVALAAAVLVLVLGLRRRPARYEPVDEARRARDTARVERAALGERVAHGQIAVPAPAPAARPSTGWPHTL